MNVRNGNTYYVDATGTLALKNVLVHSLTLRGNGGTGSLVLSDVSGDLKLDLQAPSGNPPVFLNFREFPMRFPNGIVVTTATDVKAMLVIETQQG